MSHIPRQSVTYFDFQGLRIYDYTADAEGSGSVALIEVPSGAHHLTARSTRCDKFYFCLYGVVSFTVEGEEIELQPLGLLVIGKRKWFSYQNKQTKEARLLLLHVPRFDLDAEEFQDRLHRNSG